MTTHQGRGRFSYSTEPPSRRLGPPHALERVGEVFNDQMRQSVLGGISLVLIEVAGADNLTNDASVTVKLYAGLDADEFAANNFSTPPGQDSCCEFLIDSASLTPLGQALWRAPAAIERGRLRTLAPTTFPFPLWSASEEGLETADLERVTVAARIRSDGLSEGALSGAWPMNRLAVLDNPYCRSATPRCPVTFGPTMLDLFNVFGINEADVDLDGDELECVVDSDGDARIDLCCDGSLNGFGCRSRNGACQPGVERIPALDQNDPSSCALDSRLADGFSTIMAFEAVPATIIGVGP